MALRMAGPGECPTNTLRMIIRSALPLLCLVPCKAAAQVVYYSTDFGWHTVFRATGGECASPDTLMVATTGSFWDLAQTPSGRLFGWWRSDTEPEGLYEIDTLSGARALRCPWTTMLIEFPNNLVGVDDSTFLFIGGNEDPYRFHLNTCQFDMVPGGAIPNPPAGDVVLIDSALYTITGFNGLWRYQLNAALDSVLGVAQIGTLEFPSMQYAHGLCPRWSNGEMLDDTFAAFVGNSVYHIDAVNGEAVLQCAPQPEFAEAYGATALWRSTPVGVPDHMGGSAPAVQVVGDRVTVTIDHAFARVELFALHGGLVRSGSAAQGSWSTPTDGLLPGIYFVRVMAPDHTAWVSKLFVD